MQQGLTERKKIINQAWQKHPLVISGPCSAETETQILETAFQLHQTGLIDIFRAGIWKPRTRPGSFEGIGSVGLPWLQKARELTGLPIAIEVATAKQVELALQHAIDVLWIGARTTVNPFSVQEIADALKGSAIPVFIKNPIHPDIELWQGALERIAKAGITQIGLVHRGFSSYGNTQFRYAPMWHLAIEMKRRNPGVLMLNDPSHIAGRRDIIPEIAQIAADLGYDGLMLESHHAPETAWSDALQQLIPKDLEKVLQHITWRKENGAGAAFHEALHQLRTQIDQIDDELLQLLSARMKIADKIGLYKKENNITILQARRWNEIIERALIKSDPLQLSKEFLLKYFDAVHLESINHQNRIMNK